MSSYDLSAEQNMARHLAKFAQDYGYDRFTWRGSIKSGDDPEERFAVEVSLRSGRRDSRPEVPIATVEKVETVTGDFHTEPGEPFWRVVVGEYVADFDYEEAAKNFAGAINTHVARDQEYIIACLNKQLTEQFDLSTKFAAQCEGLRTAVIDAVRFLSNDDGAGFGTTKMEDTDFFMAAFNLEQRLRNELARTEA